MRTLNDKRPPLVGFVLKTPICCPECQGTLVASDTCVVIVTDVVCKRCDLTVIEIEKQT
jgi:hypothetical protein